MVDAFVTLAGGCYFTVLHNTVVMPTEPNQRLSEVETANFAIKLYYISAPDLRNTLWRAYSTVT